MREDSKLTSVIIQSTLCFSLLVYVSLFNVSGYESYKDYYTILQYLSIVSIVVFFITNKYKLISPYTFLMAFSYLYNCGQVWLLLFGIELSYSSFTIDRYTYQNLADALSYFLLAVNFIHLFGLLSIKRNNLRNTDDERNDITATAVSKDDRSENLALKYTGFAILVLCMVLLTYNDLVQILTASQYGYTVAYTIGRDNKLIYALINLFPLSVIILMVTAQTTKVKNLVFWYAIIRSIALMLLVGNRGQYIALICTIFLLRTYLKPKIEKMRILRYVVGGFGLIFIASYVAAIRNSPSLSLSPEFIIDFIINKNAVVALLQELGGTFVNTILVMNYSPNELPYGMGISFLGSFISFIPLASKLFPEMILYNDVGSMLNQYFHKGYGLGGSFLAELYYNFGWYSLIATPIIGALFGRLFSIYEDNKTFLKQSSLKIVIITYTFYAMLMYIRGNFYTITTYMRYLVYALICYYVILTLINTRTINWKTNTKGVDKGCDHSNY